MRKGWSFFRRFWHPMSLGGMLVLAVLISLAFLLQAGSPISAAPALGPAGRPAFQATPTAPLQPTATPTNAQEINNNRDQTTGIIVGAIFLMLIIVGGTLLMERAMKEP